MVEHGADVNVETKTGFVLSEAVVSASLEKVQHLVQQGAHVNVCNAETSALKVAASNGLFEILQYLLDNGADVNDQAMKPRITALMHAVKGGHVESVRYMLAVNSPSIILHRVSNMKLDLCRHDRFRREEFRN